MNMGKRLVILFIVVLALAGIGAVVFLEFFLPDLAREEILKAANTEPDRNLEFTTIKFGYTFPLSVTLQNVQFQDKKVGGSATIPAVTIRLKPDVNGLNDLIGKRTPENFGDLELLLQNPSIQWAEVPPPKNPVPLPTPGKPKPEPKIPFGKVSIKVTDGNLSVKIPSKALTSTYEAFSQIGRAHV